MAPSKTIIKMQNIQPLPLKYFLNSKINQPWISIYPHLHTLQNKSILFLLIEFNTTIHDNQIYHKHSLLPINLTPYFIHPTYFTLQKTPKSKILLNQTIKINKSQYAKNINNKWYILTTQKIIPTYQQHIYKTNKNSYQYNTLIPYYDPLLQKYIYNTREPLLFYGSILKGISKKLMSKSEIKKYTQNNTI